MLPHDQCGSSWEGFELPVLGGLRNLSLFHLWPHHPRGQQCPLLPTKGKRKRKQKGYVHLYVSGLEVIHIISAQLSWIYLLTTVTSRCKGDQTIKLLVGSHLPGAWRAKERVIMTPLADAPSELMDASVLEGTSYPGVLRNIKGMHFHVLSRNPPSAG